MLNSVSCIWVELWRKHMYHPTLVFSIPVAICVWDSYSSLEENLKRGQS